MAGPNLDIFTIPVVGLTAWEETVKTCETCGHQISDSATSTICVDCRNRLMGAPGKSTSLADKSHLTYLKTQAREKWDEDLLKWVILIIGAAWMVYLVVHH